MTQAEALDILKLGYNVYLTGQAGSGKTHLLNQYIKYLKSKEVDVAVTASTGIAATHMNGTTIHSWSGLGIKNAITTIELKDLQKKNYLRMRIKNARVLIIDEVSMLAAEQLDSINMICKAFKKSDAPFGGLQVILCGDFFQLPPVSKTGQEAEFVYNSSSWKELRVRVCYLEEQHRQNDKQFLEILNRIRSNSVDKEILELLVTRLNQPVSSKLTPTKLYTHNLDVDAINDFELAKIKGSEQKYKVFTHGDKPLVELLKKSCLAPAELTLKKDTVVMFVKNNFDKGFVNGTLGKVIDFDKDSYPVVETFSGKKITATPETWAIEENNEILAQLSQVPLRLAWAITVHKSQGMSLDAAEIDLSKSFIEGMGYVALSRVRSLKGMKLLGLNEISLRVNGTIVELDKVLVRLSRAANLEVKDIDKKEKQRRQNDFIEVMTKFDIDSFF